MNLPTLQIYQGDSKTLKLTIKDKVENLPIDLTGLIVEFAVKKNLDDSDNQALIFKEVDTHIDATNGKTQIELTPLDMNISAGNYYYGIKVKDSSGTYITTAGVGILKMLQSI